MFGDDAVIMSGLLMPRVLKEVVAAVFFLFSWMRNGGLIVSAVRPLVGEFGIE